MSAREAQRGSAERVPAVNLAGLRSRSFSTLS